MMLSIRQTCIPRPEVLLSELADAIFAASFGHVISKEAPGVYLDPVAFFRNTHPARALKGIVTRVFGLLGSAEEAGASLRLSTGFGGGKTHALIALWHLAHHTDDPTLGTELLPAAGRPQHLAVAGIDASRWGRTIAVRHPDAVTHSLWGELAYQLGGVPALELLGDMDRPDNMPDASTLQSLLPAAPTLILIDELVVYMAGLPDLEKRQVINFVNMLVTELKARKRAVLVISDPANQAAYEDEAKKLGGALVDAAAKLDSVLSRQVSDFDPIGDESAQVITRRLFDRVERSAADQASAEYLSCYERVVKEMAELLPPAAATQDYAARLVTCYPFHPRLIDTAQNRLSAIQDFNQSRGVLRLFARVLRDIWENEKDLELISAGELDWSQESIQGDLLHRLNRDNFKAAVDADVLGHARELDAQYETDVHTRVASALLLESLPMADNLAMDRRDLTLAVLRPDEVGNEPSQAIDRLLASCWHTYRDATGNRFAFRYDPNVNKIIEERARGVLLDDAAQSVRNAVIGNFGGGIFDLVLFPHEPSAVRDSAELQLVLCESTEIARRVVSYQSEPAGTAAYPRRFRNAIVALAPRPDILKTAIDDERRLLAAGQVLQERRRAKDSREVLDQVQTIITELNVSIRTNALRAYGWVVLQGRQDLSLSERYLPDKEGAGMATGGQQRLLEFLQDNKLIYGVGDTIDPDLLVNTLLPGGVPDVAHPGAIRASSVYERALASDALRLFRNEAPVCAAILKAVEEGKLVVRQPEGDVYDAQGCVRGPEGSRQRVSLSLTSLHLHNDVLLARPDSPCVAAWLKTDDEEGGDAELLSLGEAANLKHTTVEKLQEAIDAHLLNTLWQHDALYVIYDDAFKGWWPPIVGGGDDGGAGGATAQSWDQALANAQDRPLLRLTLTANSQAAAERLLGAAHPLGAADQQLGITLSGALRAGGELNLSLTGASPTDPLKPLNLAGQLARGCQEVTYYQAVLTLSLGAGRAQMAPLLTQARQQQTLNGDDALGIEARFGPSPSATANG